MLYWVKADLAIEDYPISLPWTNSWIAFPVYFGSLSICTVEHYLISFVPWFIGTHSCSRCNIAYTMFEKKYVVCFWWDVPFHLKTFVFFPPENWAGKAFFKIYFEAKSAIILSSFNQTWLVFQYTHSLNEILKRWLPSGVILFNFIKKHQLTATVTSFILYKVTTANIRERIPVNRWIPLLACAWWQWEGRTLSGRPTFCLTGWGWWEGGDRIEKRSLSLFQHEHTTESAPAYS